MSTIYIKPTLSLYRYEKHLDVFRKKAVEHRLLEKRCCDVVVW